MTPGQGSFQTEFITSAGGLAGDFGEGRGRPVAEIKNLVSRDDLPPILETALDALATGLASLE